MSNTTVFKFREVNKNLLEALIRSQLYFANPEALNDPYDCQVDILEALERAISRASDVRKEVLQQARQGQTVFEQIHNDIKKFGVCSVSATRENQVLWAHYANEHRGVCIEYTIAEDFVIDRSINIFGFSPVSYGSDALTEFFLSYSFSEDGTDVLDLAMDAMKKVRTIKSEDWGFEEEVRMIRSESGPMEIPAEFLTQVCFGLRTSERDRSLVSELVNGKYKNVVFAELQPGDSNFGVRTVEI